MGYRYQQSIDGAVTTYSLDISADLTQVLGDGTNSYLYGLGRIGESGGGVWQYPLLDALGSACQLTDSSGHLSLSQFFEPFGAPLKVYGDASSHFGFTGEQDQIAELIFLRARYYDPGTGRFITKDPFPCAPSLPSTLHPYNYACNNPIRFTDPTGQVVWIPGILLIGAGIGGIANLINYLTSPGCIATWQGVINSFLVGALAGLIGTGVTMLVAALIPAVIPGISPFLVTTIAGGFGGLASTIIENFVIRKPITVEDALISFFVAAGAAGVTSILFPSPIFPARPGPDPQLRWTSGWPLRGAYVGVKSMYVIYEEIIEDIIGSVAALLIN